MMYVANTEGIIANHVVSEICKAHCTSKLLLS